MEDVASSGNLPFKVTAVAAGEAHTLLLTGDGRVYSWGRGTLGRLGLGSEQDQPFPAEVKFGSQDSVRIVGIAAGAYHSLALADDGSVWCWGYNLYGYYSVVPCLLNKFLELHPPDSSALLLEETEGRTPLKIISIKAGGMMSLCIDNLGALWMWGNCPNQSKEGIFSIVSNFTPTPVWDFHGHTVVKVACGNEHIIALVSIGESYNGENDDLICYSWGTNNHGQLGLGDKENRPNPEIVKTFDQNSHWSIYEIACGAFHTALLTHRKRPNDDTLESVCWTFGLGENGQLGHGTTQSSLIPELVQELPKFINLVSIDCGLFHTCVVSSDGDVWSWGMEKGLGLYPDARVVGEYSSDALSPLVVSNPYEAKFFEPVQVACGAAHTVIVAQEGYRIWSLGRGRSGVLGNGKVIDCYTPNLVLWPPLMEDFHFKQEESSSCREQDKGKEED
ncbi:E3 ISG15--protein ligase HERC5-like [Trifolium pratense]|uniref:E3 ISG15--protein ligase HERC5-like n=1 Tax=Trifolium pratense TaxID=57577 RepID=UPI001E6955A2|nr:E3 ISG15--protein ligase HERC5-like [Trifolium pratense]